MFRILVPDWLIACVGTLSTEGLSISPIRKDETDESENIARRALWHVVTELPAEVHGWTGFAKRFFHLRTERLSRALLPNCAPSGQTWARVRLSATICLPMSLRSSGARRRQGDNLS